MSQQPLFVPAPAGWYARPGDPPGVTRHWDGKAWQCDVRGPMKDHFNHLRSMAPDTRSPADQDLLKQLTRDVSAVEDLVLGDPSGNPPLVQIAAPPPYIPPAVPMGHQPMGQAPGPLGQQGPASAPSHPYGPAYGLPGPPVATGGQPRFSAPRTATKGRGLRVGLVVTLVAVVVGVLGIGAKTILSGSAIGSSTAALAVSQCVTLSQPAGATDAKSVTWSSSECTTPIGGPVSFVVVSQLDGAAQCDPDSQYVQTFGVGNKVTNTYCLMENLAAGQCVYEDDKGFLYDVACTDTRALVKVASRVDKGSGVECASGQSAWRFPAGNRTYCLSKP